MKKLKIAICALLLLFCGIGLTACGKKGEFDLNEIQIKYDTTNVSYNETTGSYEMTYNGFENSIAVAYETSLKNFKVTYSLDGTNFNTGDKIKLKDAGTYNIYYKLSAPKYKDYVSEEPIKFEIKPKPITVTANDVFGFNDENYYNARERVFNSLNYNLVGADRTLDYTVNLVKEKESENDADVVYGSATLNVNDRYAISIVINDGNYKLANLGRIAWYYIADTYGINTTDRWAFYSDMNEAYETVADETTITVVKMFRNDTVGGVKAIFDDDNYYNVKLDTNGFTLAKILKIDRSASSKELDFELMDSTITKSGEVRGIDVTFNAYTKVKLTYLKVNATNGGPALKTLGVGGTLEVEDCHMTSTATALELTGDQAHTTFSSDCKFTGATAALITSGADNRFSQCTFTSTGAYDAETKMGSAVVIAPDSNMGAIYFSNLISTFRSQHGYAIAYILQAENNPLVYMEGKDTETELGDYIAGTETQFENYFTEE